MNGRNQILASLNESEYDLLVIGGGFLGAGIALEAASAGLTVLVVDRDDFAAGASSRTSKIAGAPNHIGSPGIKDLFKSAPHMVRDFTFMMPVTTNGLMESFRLQAILALRDIKSGVLGKRRGHKRVGKKDALRLAPALAPSIVTGGLSFHDCFFDDSRYTLELLKTAATRGALAVNYLEAKSFDCRDGEITSVVLRDRIEGQEYTVKPRVVVSASGAWSHSLAQLISPGEIEETAQVHLEKTRTTHIILPPSAVEVDTALLLPVGQDRYISIVPWQRALLVGGSRQVSEDGPENPVPTTEDINFLLDWINRYKRSGRKVTREDIACAWSGFELATDEKNGKPSVFRGPNGVIMAYGCHLRDLRETAKKATHLVAKRVGLNYSADAQKEPVMLGGFVDKQDYLVSTAQISARARRLTIEPASLDHLISNYGKDAMLVLDLIEENPALNEKICPDFAPLMAEVVHCVNNEMAVSLEDVLCRRIRLGFLHREQCLDASPRVSRMMQELCGWDSQRLKGELGNLARNLASQLAPVS